MYRFLIKTPLCYLYLSKLFSLQLTRSLRKHVVVPQIQCCSTVVFSEEEKLNTLISSECLNSYQEPDKMQTRPKPGSDCPVSVASTPWRGLCADNRSSVTISSDPHFNSQCKEKTIKKQKHRLMQCRCHSLSLALQYDKGDERNTENITFDKMIELNLQRLNSLLFNSIIRNEILCISVTCA